MTAARALAANDFRPGFRLPPSLMRGIRGYAYLANVPVNPDQASLAGCTPQISELVDDTLPLVWHLMSRHSMNDAMPVCFIYINPRQHLTDNAEALLQLLQGLDGMEAAVVPVSGSHASILHSFRIILPQLKRHNLSRIRFMYIGDNANRRPMEAIAGDCHMPLFYHALY